MTSLMCPMPSWRSVPSQSYAYCTKRCPFSCRHSLFLVKACVPLHNLKAGPYRTYEPKKLSKFGAKKGAWAVVTGSTDGIGKEFALQLAKAGFNILLVARNVELLNSTSQEIRALFFFFSHSSITWVANDITESKFNVKAQTHVIDFTKAGAQEYEELANALQKLDIGVLGE